MSRPVSYSPEAESQLVSLFRYLAREASESIAQCYIEAIVAQCEKLTDYPSRGTPRNDLRAGMRTLAFRRRVMIAYVVEPDEVIILGIFCGGQDYETLLSDRSAES